MSCRRSVLVSSVAVLVSLGGGSCDKTRPSVQYEKGINASTTLTRTLLTVPPEFGLRPAASGTGEDHAVTHAMREKGVERADHSVGVAVLLQATGIDRILPGIRALIDHEHSLVTTEMPAFIERLMFLRAPDPRQTAILDGEPIHLPVAPSGKDIPDVNPDTDLSEGKTLRLALPPPTIRREEEKRWLGLF